jgi:hypothetical protein
MKLVYLLMLTLLLPAVLFCDLFETSLDADFQGNWNGLLLYRGKLANVGFNSSWSVEGGEREFMAGGNVRGFSIGHLEDSGLATEIRNPGADALSRLSERTLYSADPRSDSRSRMGFSFSGFESRVIFGLERRESIDAIFALGVPLVSGPWKMELLCEGGNLREPEADDAWYPTTDSQAAGPFGLVSTRLRYLPGAFSAGISGMVSGGISLAPGWLTSLSANYTAGPWRIRGRGVVSSQYFRNADGELLNEPLGLAADWRYRPDGGFQFAADYEVVLTARDTGGFSPEDLCNLAVGWRFGETMVSIETDWNRAFFPLPDDEESTACRRISGSLDWDRGYYHLGISGDWEPEGESDIRADFTTPLGSSVILDGYGKLRGASGDLYLDMELEVLVKFGQNKIISTVLVEDLMQRLFEPSGPVADFTIEVRWVRQFGK